MQYIKFLNFLSISVSSYEQVQYKSKWTSMCNDDDGPMIISTVIEATRLLTHYRQV